MSERRNWVESIPEGPFVSDPSDIRAEEHTHTHTHSEHGELHFIIFPASFAIAGMCYYWKWTLLSTAESSVLSQLSQLVETQQTQLPKASSLLIDTHKITMPRCHGQEVSIPHLRSIINKWPSQTGRIVRSPPTHCIHLPSWWAPPLLVLYMFCNRRLTTSWTSQSIRKKNHTMKHQEERK